ncbi:MAG: hypothetical protein IPG45_25960 [Deltaproteobacteria bacterium]|nr:hypothetical protein [Deltaproteobacteria bacterium]
MANPDGPSPLSEVGGGEPVAEADPRPNAYADRVENGASIGQAVPEGEGCALGNRDPIRGIGASGVVPPAPPPAHTGDVAVREDLGVGARRRAGIQSVGGDTGSIGQLGLTRDLLSRSLEQSGNGAAQQLRFRIGDETLTAGQLRQAIDQDPARFRDFLRSHGIAPAELNELLDDLNSGTVAPGTEIDLRPGSEIARAYHLGGPGGEVVDSHLDRSGTEAAAAREATVGDRQGLRGERVEGPGFFEMIGEALAEAAAAIARAFGSSWNPDTVTFNGRVDDAHFRDVGRRAATGDQALVMQSVLSSPRGEAELRRQLEAQRPPRATETQWNRAVNDYLQGARGALAEQTRAGTLPAMNAAEGQEAALYLRAHGYSQQAQAEVRTVLAQPPAVRGEAMRMLNELPDAERANLLTLFTPSVPPEGEATDAEYNADMVRSGYEAGNAETRTAIFQAFARDGFRTPATADSAVDVVQSARAVENLPAELRPRAYALVGQLGPERAHLLGGTGLFQQLQHASSPAHAQRLLTDFEARLSSTHDLQRLLGANGAEISLPQPTAGTITREADQATVVRAFDAHNLRLRAQDTGTGEPLVITARGTGANEISLQRYFSDRTYRDDVLRRTGMTRASFEGLLTNVSDGVRRDDSGTAAQLQGERTGVRRQLLDPATSLPERERLTHRLQQIDQQLEVFQAPTNIELDIRAGSRIHQLFDLSGPGGARHAELQLAAESVRDGGGDYSVRLRAPGTGRRPGPEYTIDRADLAGLIPASGDLDAARRAFGERYPGLDFDETVRAFSRLDQLDRNGSLPSSEGPIDFTRGQRNRDLEAVRRTLVDGRANNTRSAAITFQLGAVTTSDRANTQDLISDARLGATSSNQWYQYGVFFDTGYQASERASTRARQAYRAAGNQPDPAIPLNALFQIDDYRATTLLRSGERTRENGVAHGQTEDFLVDPRTGARAEGRDLQVLSFSGRGSASDRASFQRSSERVADMFRRYGGVPEGQVEVHHRPTPETMMRAIEGEILRDPRDPAARLDAEGRTRPRTVVVHFAGHTGSFGSRGDREVSGLMLTDERGQRVDITPEQLEQLNRTARDHGVNLVWVIDACRGGEFVDQARSLDQQALSAAGQLPVETQHLQGLREGLREQHTVLSRLSDMRPRSPMPNAEGLARLGSRALQGGDGSPALTELRARRDRVVTELGADSNEALLMNRYVAGIESTLTHRSALAGTPGLSAITNDGTVTGATQWRAGRSFMTFTLGPLEDKITEQLRTRLPDPPVVARPPQRVGVGVGP